MTFTEMLWIVRDINYCEVLGLGVYSETQNNPKKKVGVDEQH